MRRTILPALMGVVLLFPLAGCGGSDASSTSEEQPVSSAEEAQKETGTEEPRVVEDSEIDPENYGSAARIDPLPPFDPDIGTWTFTAEGSGTADWSMIDAQSRAEGKMTRGATGELPMSVEGFMPDDPEDQYVFIVETKSGGTTAEAVGCTITYTGPGYEDGVVVVHYPVSAGEKLIQCSIRELRKEALRGSDNG